MGEAGGARLTRTLALLLLPLLAAPALSQQPARSVLVDERLAADLALRVGDRVVLATAPGQAGDTAVVAGVARRRADPSEVARGDYRVRLHLDHLQRLLGAGDRVDRFAVQTRGGEAGLDSARRAIDAAAFGFRAHRSRDIAAETSTTFAVVSRFHKAIGVITIVASAIFLLCIMLLKVEERRRDVAALRLMGISAGSVMRSVMIEAAFIAAAGSALGVAIGAAASATVNWHYRGVYRTPLAFSLVTVDVVLLAAALSVALGLAAGWAAARRLLGVPPLALFGR